MISRLRNPNVFLLVFSFCIMLVVGTDLVLKNTYVAPEDLVAKRRKAFVESWKPKVPLGSQAPEFRLRDRNGTYHSLSEFRGKPLVLAFYSADPRSRKFALEFQKIWKHIGIPLMSSMAVVNFPEAETPAFIKATGDRSLFVFEEDGATNVRDTYGAVSVPSAWVIDRRGRIVYATPPIETDGVPEPELEMVYRSLRGMLPLEFPQDPRVPKG